MIFEKPSTYSRFVVIGANGGIGKQIVGQALHRGHTVLAVLRNPNRLSIRHPNLFIQKADIMVAESLQDIFKPEDIIISAIGKNTTKETVLYSQGTANIMQAMARANATRLFVISAAGLDVNPTHNLLLRWATKNILQRILKNMYADLRQMEHAVKSSSLLWTIVRPPRLTDRAGTGIYRTATDSVVTNGQHIARADVANFIVNNTDTPSIVRTTVEIAY